MSTQVSMSSVLSAVKSLDEKFEMMMQEYRALREEMMTQVEAEPEAEPEVHAPKHKGTRAQCKGHKPNMDRCKSKIVMANGYCLVHQVQAGEDRIEPAPKPEPEPEADAFAKWRKEGVLRITNMTPARARVAAIEEGFATFCGPTKEEHELAWASLGYEMVRVPGRTKLFAIKKAGKTVAWQQHFTRSQAKAHKLSEHRIITTDVDRLLD